MNLFLDTGEIVSFMCTWLDQCRSANSLYAKM